MKPFVSKPLEIPANLELASRVDLIFYEVDHSGPSYEARVFVDKPRASAQTALEAEAGFVGSFTIFGHAGCYGEAGHCHPSWPSTDEFDRRPPHPLAPFTRQITATEALKPHAGTAVPISVVPVVVDVKGVRAPDTRPVGWVRVVAYEG